MSAPLSTTGISSDEECACAIGKAAGIFLRLQHDVDGAYGSATSLLTHSRYDKRVLESIVPRINKSIAIIISKKNQAHKAKSELAYNSICSVLKTGEITNPERDYAYFFHRGALSEMCEGE